MRVVFAQTDMGDAYVKPLGGCDDGPHPLACEWVGSQLARWFGIPVPDFAIMQLGIMEVQMIQCKGLTIQEGPAFCSKALTNASPWTGGNKQLANLDNIDIIPKIVVFDTWTLNWDRYPPKDDRRKPNYDNILFDSSEIKGHLRILPIDFGECFSMSRTLSAKIANIDRMKSFQIYGLFPAFEQFVNNEKIEAALIRMKSITRAEITEMINSIPKEWQVDSSARGALLELIIGRASFLSDNIHKILKPYYGEMPCKP